MRRLPRDISRLINDHQWRRRARAPLRIPRIRTQSLSSNVHYIIPLPMAQQKKEHTCGLRVETNPFSAEVDKKKTMSTSTEVGLVRRVSPAPSSTSHLPAIAQQERTHTKTLIQVRSRSSRLFSCQLRLGRD
jgi:hypothetical protein